MVFRHDAILACIVAAIIFLEFAKYILNYLQIFILAEGAIALPVTPSGGARFAS